MEKLRVHALTLSLPDDLSTLSRPFPAPPLSTTHEPFFFFKLIPSIPSPTQPECTQGKDRNSAREEGGGLHQQITGQWACRQRLRIGLVYYSVDFLIYPLQRHNRFLHFKTFLHHRTTLLLQGRTGLNSDPMQGHQSLALSLNLNHGPGVLKY